MRNVESLSPVVPAAQIQEVWMPDTGGGRNNDLGSRRRVLEQMRPGENAGATTFRLDPKGEVFSLVLGRVLVGGETARGQRIIHAPSGARGKEITPEELQKIEDTLNRKFPYWVPITAEHAPSLGETEKQEEPPEAGLLVMRLHPVHAPWAIDNRVQRLDEEEIKKQSTKARARLRGVETSMSDPDNAATAERSKALLTELNNAAYGNSAYFGSRLLIGAVTEDQAYDFAHTAAYTLSTAHPTHRFIPGEATDRADALSQEASAVPTVVIAAQTDHVPEVIELQGVTIHREPAFGANHQMRKRHPDEAVADFGTRTVLGIPGESVLVPLSYLAGNVLVYGKSGSTKTTRVQKMLRDYAGSARIQVIDPKATDYPEQLARLLARENISPEKKQVVAVRLISEIGEKAKEQDNIPLSLNPFAPFPGSSLQLHAEGFAANIENSAGKISVQGADDAYVAALVQRFANNALMGAEYTDTYGNKKKLKGIYEEAGHDLQLNRPSDLTGDPPLPTVEDFMCKIDEMIEAEGYAADVKANVKAIVLSRIREVFSGLSGEILRDGLGYALDLEKIATMHHVISLDGFSDKTKTFLMGLFLQWHEEKIRARGIPESEQVNEITVIEEIQDLLQPGSSLTTKIGDEFRGTRKTGRTIIGVAQNASFLRDEIRGNATLQIACLTTNGADVEAIKTTMNLDTAQTRKLTGLERGQAMIRGRDIPQVMLVEQTASSSDLENPDAQPLPTASVAKLGVDKKHYDRETVILAERLLEDTQTGRELTGWVEFELLTHGLDVGHVFPSEAILARLRAQPKEIRDRAIGRAVTKSVGSRTQLRNEPLATYLTRRLCAIANDLPPPEVQQATRGVLRIEAENEVEEFQRIKDLLFPPISRRFALNHAVGANFAELLTKGKEKTWQDTFQRFISSFIFTNPDAKEKIATAVTMLYDRAVRDRDEKKGDNT